MAKGFEKKALYNLLIERGLAEDRQRAESLVLAGKVFVGGRKAGKAGDKVAVDADISVKKGKEFVGRGGIKLSGALKSFKVSAHEKVCADVGSSTGGFTEVLLNEGARKVFAIDVGYGELDYKLRKDPRVCVMERTNARELKELPEPVSLVTMDVSFISVTKILPAIRGWLSVGGNDLIVLIKPQFEAPREKVEEGGVIKSLDTRRLVLESVLKASEELGYGVFGLCQSPIKGGDGNIEYFAWLRSGTRSGADTGALINRNLAFESLE